MSRKINRSVSALTTVILIMAVLVGGFSIGYHYVISQNKRFSQYDTQNIAIGSHGEDKKIVIGKDTPGAVMVYVRYGERTSDIARKLEKLNLISHPSLFVLMSKINGFDGGYQYGTHFLKEGMSYDEIMYNLTLKPSASNITFREGLTYKQMKQLLHERGVLFDEAMMDDIINSPRKYFADMPLLETLKALPGREWLLQGYLFPDTYSFDLNTDSRTIIETMLNNAELRITSDYHKRAKKMGMSMDEVINLAAIIQMESGNIQEMYKISRVFHNRLDMGMALQSCATINYVRAEQNLPRLLVISENDLNLDTPYNTYKNIGLPPGPICNPGLEAIRAALYPSNEPDDRKLLYFSATGDGHNVFSDTFDEHLKNVRKYVLPLAKEQGFDGNLDTGKNVIYSSGGTIIAPTKSKSPKTDSRNEAKPASTKKN